MFFLVICSLVLPSFCSSICEPDKQVFPTIFSMHIKIFWNITVIYLVLFGLVFLQENNLKISIQFNIVVIIVLISIAVVLWIIVVTLVIINP